MAQFVQFALVRAGMALFTLLMVSLIVFSLMELVPGLAPSGIWPSRTPKAPASRSPTSKPRKDASGSTDPFWCAGDPGSAT